MQRSKPTAFYQGSKRETIATLTISGLTLLVLIGAGYFTPNLLALAVR